MSELDDTDAEILRLLIEDAERSYTEIGEAVGLTPPTISDRIDRLRDLGVIRRFTIDVDRSLLSTGDGTLVEMRVRPGRASDLVRDLRDVDGIHTVTRTRDARVLARTHRASDRVDDLLSDVVGAYDLTTYGVHPVAESIWTPELGDGDRDLAIRCVECGRRVGEEGVSLELDGRRYHLCCPSCETVFRDRYEDLKAGAERAGSRG